MLTRESVNIKTMYRNALIINHGRLQSDSTVGQEMITLQMVCGVIHVANIIISLQNNFIKSNETISVVLPCLP